MARRLNFVYYSKISIKLNKPLSKPSKPTVSTYQAKQARFRCEKFQASKLRLSGLACLLNSKSTYKRRGLNSRLTSNTSNIILKARYSIFRCVLVILDNLSSGFHKILNYFRRDGVSNKVL